jgi:hypothetical protein
VAERVDTKNKAIFLTPFLVLGQKNTPKGKESVPDLKNVFEPEI